MDGVFVTILILGLCLVVMPALAFCIKARQRRNNQGQVFSSEFLLGGIIIVFVNNECFGIGGHEKQWMC